MYKICPACTTLVVALAVAVGTAGPSAIFADTAAAKTTKRHWVKYKTVKLKNGQKGEALREVLQMGTITGTGASTFAGAPVPRARFAVSTPASEAMSDVTSAYQASRVTPQRKGKAD
jgi:hypothetical protein